VVLLPADDYVPLASDEAGFCGLNPNCQLQMPNLGALALGFVCLQDALLWYVTVDVGQ
jgi:hypothetical protein